MDRHVIVGVHVTDRLENASQVQAVLTEYGCHIKTRLGLHETIEDGRRCCSKNGLLLLEVVGEMVEINAMITKLSAIQGLEVQKMVFEKE